MIDFGAGSMEAGLSGDDTPSKVFTPAIAYDEDNNIIIGYDIEKYEKENKKPRDKHYVIKRGVPQKLDKMLQIMKYIINDTDPTVLEKRRDFNCQWWIQII